MISKGSISRHGSSYRRWPGICGIRSATESVRRQERGFEVDHSTINCWVLAYAPMIEKRLRQCRRLHCGSVRIDETYVKIRGKWRYLASIDSLRCKHMVTRAGVEKHSL